MHNSLLEKSNKNVKVGLKMKLKHGEVEKHCNTHLGLCEQTQKSKKISDLASLRQAKIRNQTFWRLNWKT